MKKQFSLVSYLVIIAVLSTTAIGQQGNAMMKIVKSEDGSVKVFDMQGNEIHQSKTDANVINSANHTKETGIFQSQEIHQVISDPSDPEISNEIDQLEQQQTGNIVTGEGVVASESTDPVILPTIESHDLYPSNWDNATEVNDLQAIEEIKGNITLLNPGPDLTIPAGTWNSYSYTAPILTITIRIINIGTTTAGFSYVGYYLSTNNTITTGDYFIGQDYVSSLAPGAISDETKNVNLCNMGTLIPPGTYYVGVYADYTNAVAEDNETNNSGNYGITMTWSTSGCGNLTCYTGSAYNYYSFNSTTCALTNTIRIKNSGSVLVGSSYVGYYLSADTVIELNDVLIGTDYVSSLAVGAYSDETITIADISQFVAPGSWYVGFYIDYMNQVNEFNENDNGWYTPPAIISNCSCVNLTAKDQPVSFNYNSSNCQLDIKVRIINDGTCKANSNSTVGYYLSSDTEITTSDCKLGTDTVFDLAAGEYTARTISIDDICSKTCVEAGAWYVGFIIDEENDVAESNENDNAWHFTPSIDITCPCEGGGCTLAVTSPNGGEEWGANTVHEVTWSNTGTCPDVKIMYSLTGGEPWTEITDSTPNDGSFEWTLPDLESTEANCKIKISCADETCTDESDNPFTIQVPIEYKRRYIAAKLPSDAPLPVIDGVLDDLAWSIANPPELLEFYNENGAWHVPWDNWTDNRVQWYAIWSSATNMLYVAIEVEDDIAGIIDHDFDQMRKDDDIQLFIDGDLSGGEYSGYEDAQRFYIRRDNAKSLGWLDPPEYTGTDLISAVQYGEDGNWNIEVALKIYNTFNTNQRYINVGNVIGWEVWYGDSDNETEIDGKWDQDHQVGWAYTGTAWNNADFMQELEFGEEVIPNGILNTPLVAIDEFCLFPNYPNPFNNTTLIKYSIPENNYVEIKVYDIMGQEIKTLKSKEELAGNHSIEWDGRNQEGTVVSSGLYFCIIKAGKYNAVNKMVLLK